MTGNETVGSSLFISKDLIKQLEDADKKFQDLAASATKMQNSFQGIANSLTPIISALTGMGDAANKAAQQTEASMRSADSSTKNLNNSITQAAENVNKLSNSLTDQREKWRTTYEGAMYMAKTATDANNLTASIQAQTQAVKYLIEARNQLSLTDNDYRFKTEMLSNAIQRLNESIARAKMSTSDLAAARSKANNPADYYNAMYRADNAKTIQEQTKAIQDLKTARDNLSKTDSEYSSKLTNLNDKIQQLTRNIKESKMSTDDRIAAQKKEEEAALKAAKALEKQAQAEYKLRAAQYQQANYKQNTTVQGSLSFAESASTINRRTQAIKYLQAARASLSSTDSQYTQKLQTLNAAIREMNTQNKKAIEGSQALQSAHRNLMDITGQLARSLALCFSVSQIKQYIGQMIQVRGQFELQQVALESILQNKNAADEIFDKTVQLAVRSPFRIQQLITYTKQLAAFRVESDKLYDTTKRLADVSAGLGVSMDRIILAYGQIKAANFLKGTEVRQLTEAGINIYSELQKYYEEVEHEQYSIAQIVKMISNKQVTFEDVDAIFHRMTDEGGLFYQMQETQAKTLRGLVTNLKDSMDIMFNDIGKASESTVKEMITITKSLFTHWQEIVDIVKVLASVFVILKVQALAAGVSIKKVFTAEFTTQAALGLTTLQRMNYAWLNMKKAVIAFGMSLKTAFANNWVIILLLTLGDALLTVIDRTKRYHEAVQQSRSAYNDAMQPINKLTAAYRKLANAVKDNTKANTEDLDTIQEKRDLVQQMIDKLNEISYDTGLSSADIPVNDLDKTFDQLSSKYEELQNNMKQAAQAYAKLSEGVAGIEGPFGIFGDNIKTDAKDLINSEQTILGKTKDITQAVQFLAANYDSMNEKQKKYYDQIASGKGEYEEEAEYLMRAYEVIREVRNAYDKTNKSIFKNLNTYLNQLGGGWTRFKNDIEEFQYELSKLKVEYENRGIDTESTDDESKKTLLVVLDDEKAKQQWDDLELKIARTEFNIPVYLWPKVGEEEDKTPSITKQLKDNFKDGKLTFDLETNLTTPEAFEEEDKYAQGLIKEWKTLQKAKENYARADIKPANYDAKADAERQKEIKDQLTAMGYDFNSLINGSSKKGSQRDILQERISLLKEMMSEYEKLRKMQSATASRSNVLQQNEEAANGLGMWQIFDKSSFTPTKAEVADAIEKLARMYSDEKKRNNALKEAAKLRIEIDEENLRKELDMAKQQVNEAFEGLQLTNKLNSAGLHFYEVKDLFPDIATSFDQVEEKIRQSYGITNEMLSLTAEEMEKVMGTDKYKQYTEDLKKLDQDRVNSQRDTIQQLVKDYKNVLNSQLNIDLWYTKERKKIYDNISDTNMQQEMIRNLNKARNNKSNDLIWNNFKESGFYATMFSDIEHASTRMLNMMKQRLNDVRTSLNQLDPDKLKEIADLESKIDDRLAETNPFKSLKENFGNAITYLKNRKQIEEDITKELQHQETLKGFQAMYGTELDNLQNQADDLETKVMTEDDQKKLEDIKRQIRFIQNTLNNIQDDLDESEQKVTDLTDQDRKGKEYLNKTIEAFDKLAATIQEVTKVSQTLGENWQQIFGGISAFTEDFFESLQDIGNGFYNMADGMKSAFEGITSHNYIQALQGIGGTISGLISTIGSIFAIGDKKKQREINNLQNEVDNLSRAYDKLKEKMDDAWDITALQTYQNESRKTLEAELANYKQMLKLEQDKKKTDKDKVKEYQETIEDLEDDLKELEENFYESLGGFGSDANFKSAAEEFADAWVSAFQESDDALQALKDEFTDLFASLIKKQISTRLASTYIQPILDAMDNALVDEQGNARDLDTMVAMLADAWAGIDEAAEGYDAAASRIMELLKSYGIDLTSSSSDLSALQQGLQSMTEQTADALESILNSVRFFVAQEQADVAALKAYLVDNNAFSNLLSVDSPIITELKSQTVLVRSIEVMLSRVIKPSTKGWGIIVQGIS